MEEIKISVDKGLPYIFERIKKTAIHRAIGKEESWMYMRMKGRMPWNKKTLKILNDGIHQIGEDLLNVRIEYTSDRDRLGEQVIELRKVVKSSYLCEALNYSIDLFQHRVYSKVHKGFSEEEIAMMNMTVFSIANQLIHIELTL